MSDNNYKDTLNMPKTDFEMRGNLTTKEPEFRKYWEKINLYEKVLEKNKNNKPFIIHDGPPYANGSLHIGHALNKILKDIIVRYKSLQGFYSPFVPGWDTHGLPIEHKMLEEAQLNFHNLNPVELRKKARDYAMTQVEKQKQEFLQMQLLSDFKKFYITLDPKFEARQLKLFKKMVFSNLVYKGLKPVYWSPSSQSALAEAEVEYKDIKSPSIFVAFKIVDNNKSKKINTKDNLVIWTTTPWTLIANAGVAIGKNIKYSKVQVKTRFFIVATDLIKKVAKELEWNKYKIVESLSEKDLLGLKYESPVNKNICPVVEGHHVTTESGSGLVHIAPLFGEDDFLIGNKNQLEKIMHIEDDGTINEYGGIYRGLFYLKANKLICENLLKSRKLLKEGTITHSYPHDWRTKKPILFRGTPQWFVSINKCRQEILIELDKVKTYPDWAKKRLSNMISERQDWTISRQRTWGVPIIIFYDENNEPVINEAVFDYVIEEIEKYGTDIWWERDTDQLLPEQFRGKGYTREMDIMDVWFDSGSTSIAVDIVDGLKPPYDIYLEGSDQYRGWFNSSLINSVIYNAVAPYKQIISHGFVLDGKGEKMSKSKGNVVAPLNIIEKQGADILRLWIANSEYTNDVTISDAIIKQNSEIYRKIRNTIKFILGNLDDYEYEPNLKLTGVHEFIKEDFERIKEIIIKYYDEFKFINVIKELNNYIVELSSFYLSVVKDILYIEEKNSLNRRMVQKNLYEIVEFLIIALAPILPTTCEDAYSYFNKNNKLESVHLETMPTFRKANSEILLQWKEFFKIRDEVNILLEQAIKDNLIKRTNEAKLVIDLKQNEFLKSINLKQLLMVGVIEFGSEMKVTAFESDKCLRCWNHFQKNKIEDGLCPQCHKIIFKGNNE
ncbi:isoleucine--tRNA ligase [Mycoplasma sp. Mirounga ES2805-ORL]|uniref:isoleucine--tRNA ligase n=1 Tax=Mycoplasma sp. Mirounga ES2805-ORL TaxID=754514 RepID=UPI00197BDB52|nr:isoleucine--tRNA ligase [Mycoplasma sp. Mirounga ES2805-ORL]QSF13934.1 isoleucine--tRNA ligase [Mycoplasma sp. Mirounga ES2805-ORL]